MNNTFLIITSIANSENLVLKQYAEETAKRDIPFILIGDTKSPKDFYLPNCDFYSIDRQRDLKFKLTDILPTKHYARKNLGYLIGISQGAEIIIETDDDNIPLNCFWEQRKKQVDAHLLTNKQWVNVYQHFTDVHIWPRGFSLEHIRNNFPSLENTQLISCPIQQGLADENPDVDAIYRLTLPLPINFQKANNIALGSHSICPFNSQNTTWFKETFPLLYLPSYCSFRMTDIWRSFIAQRIAWTCKWPILFHHSTVLQERNYHNLMNDFKEEVSGYYHNTQIMEHLIKLDLKEGAAHIPGNMIRCYSALIELGLVAKEEMDLLNAWLQDIQTIS